SPCSLRMETTRTTPASTTTRTNLTRWRLILTMSRGDTPARSQYACVIARRVPSAVTGVALYSVASCSSEARDLLTEPGGQRDGPGSIANYQPRDNLRGLT